MLLKPYAGVPKTVLWNRNRRNRNFSPCGTETGTGTQTCQKVGPGTVTYYDSGTVINNHITKVLTNTQYKMCV